MEIECYFIHALDNSFHIKKVRRDRFGMSKTWYVQDICLCKRRAALEVHGFETVWVVLQVKHKRILIGH